MQLIQLLNNLFFNNTQYFCNLQVELKLKLDYKLVVTNTDGEIIDTYSFEIVTEDTIADAIKEEENIFSKIIDPDLFE